MRENWRRSKYREHRQLFQRNFAVKESTEMGRVVATLGERPGKHFSKMRDNPACFYARQSDLVKREKVML